MAYETHAAPPGWNHITHSDGMEQHWMDKNPAVCIEWYTRGRRRTKPVLTDRSVKTHNLLTAKGKWDNNFPPVLAGPFPDVEAAKAALLLVNSSLT